MSANAPSRGRMPVVFFGHGSPMNTLARNRHTQAWRSFGERLGNPRAILSVSAHWYLRETAATAMPQPRTIHDFGGFPQALHRFLYPAAGDPALARRIADLLAPLPVRLDRDWGLDHGTWSVLAHLYPGAEFPVVQLAIDSTQPGEFHLDLGRQLSSLRDEGVLIVGSGDVVHNLATMLRDEDAAPYPWATRFNDEVRALLGRGEHAPLLAPETLGEHARLSVPTPDHYLPLLYVLGARHRDDDFELITDGIELGSISMLSFAYRARTSADSTGLARL